MNGYPSRLRKAADEILEDVHYSTNTFTIHDSDMLREAADAIERLAADNARLAAEVERLTPVWTWEMPKAVGWYRARSKAARGMPLGAKQYAIFISDLDIARQPDQRNDYQWAGPFPEPMEPDQKPV